MFTPINAIPNVVVNLLNNRPVGLPSHSEKARVLTVSTRPDMIHSYPAASLSLEYSPISIVPLLRLIQHQPHRHPGHPNMATGTHLRHLNVTLERPSLTPHFHRSTHLFLNPALFFSIGCITIRCTTYPLIYLLVAAFSQVEGKVS